MTISKTEAREYLDDPILCEPTGDVHRWSVGYRIVFLHTDGKHYEARYRRGTGDDGESPWQDENTVACQEVHRVSKVVTVWERIAS